MRLHQSNASFDFSSQPGREAPRTRIGITMLAAVVALLDLLNLLAGAA
jgi:hypothetical protein